MTAHEEVLYTAFPFSYPGARRPSGAMSLSINGGTRPLFDSMRRPRIAEVRGDKILLNGTTMDEFEKHHYQTLMLTLNETNAWIAEDKRKKFEEKQKQLRLKEEHETRP